MRYGAGALCALMLAVPAPALAQSKPLLRFDNAIDIGDYRDAAASLTEAVALLATENGLTLSNPASVASALEADLDTLRSLPLPGDGLWVLTADVQWTRSPPRLSNGDDCARWLAPSAFPSHRGIGSGMATGSPTAITCEVRMDTTSFQWAHGSVQRHGDGALTVVLAFAGPTDVVRDQTAQDFSDTLTAITRAVRRP